MESENYLNNFSITLYTIGCNHCKALEKMLDSKNVKYTICEDLELMEKKGFKNAPMLEINGHPYSFAESVKILNGKMEVRADGECTE